MIILTHADWQNFVDGLLFGTQTKPSANGYYLILCNMASPITQSTPKNTIISQELSGDGYVRKNLTGGTLTNVSGNSTRTYPAINYTFTATKSYRYLVLLANAVATPADTTGVIVGIIDEGTDQLIIANQELEINVSYIIPGVN